MTQIATKWIEDTAVTADKLNSDVVGSGLQGAAGSALSIKPDVTTGVTVAPLAVGANGAGVTVDDSAIKHTAGTLSVKALGITDGMLAGSISDGKLATPYIKADGTRAFTGAQAMGGFKITGLGAPGADSDAARKVDVDNAKEGLDVKDSVRLATTSADSAKVLATDFDNGKSIAEGTLATGDRILIKDLSTGSQNGIYIVEASGIPTRADDYAAGSSAANTFMFVEEGTTLQDTGWVCTNNAPNDVVGTDALVFTQFTGAGSFNAGAGLTKSGNTLNVGEKLGDGIGGEGGGIKANADDLELQVDGVTIEITDVVSDPGVVRIKDAGVDENKIVSTAIGVGLTGGSGSTIDVKPDVTGGANLAKVISAVANGLAVKIDDDTIGENGSNRLYVKANSIGAAEIDETDTYDYTSGIVNVFKQATGNNTTLAASTSFVQQEISGMSTETVTQEMHKVTAGEVTAGYFTLASSPDNAQSVRVTPVKGPMQINKQVVGATGATPDFDVLSTNQVHINNDGAATGLSGDIKVDDILIIVYAV